MTHRFYCYSCGILMPAGACPNCAVESNSKHLIHATTSRKLFGPGAAIIDAILIMLFLIAAVVLLLPPGIALWGLYAGENLLPLKAEEWIFCVFFAIFFLWMVVGFYKNIKDEVSAQRIVKNKKWNPGSAIRFTSKTLGLLSLALLVGVIFLLLTTPPYKGGLLKLVYNIGLAWSLFYCITFATASIVLALICTSKKIPVSSEKKHCKLCRHVSENDHNYCFNCGASLAIEQSQLDKFAFFIFRHENFNFVSREDR